MQVCLPQPLHRGVFDYHLNDRTRNNGAKFNAKHFNISPLISLTVSMLFNKGDFPEGIFPECFKAAKIISIFKTGDSNFLLKD